VGLAEEGVGICALGIYKGPGFDKFEAFSELGGIQGVVAVFVHQKV
jgi:hypothetical protein